MIAFLDRPHLEVISISSGHDCLQVQASPGSRLPLWLSNARSSCCSLSARKRRGLGGACLLDPLQSHHFYPSAMLAGCVLWLECLLKTQDEM